MTTLHVQDQIAAELKAQAEAKGLSLDDYLLTIVQLSHANLPLAGKSGDVQDFDLALDELFAGDKRPLPRISIPDSRSDIYTNHD